MQIARCHVRETRSSREDWGNIKNRDLCGSQELMQWYGPQKTLESVFEILLLRIQQNHYKIWCFRSPRKVLKKNRTSTGPTFTHHSPWATDFTRNSSRTSSVTATSSANFSKVEVARGPNTAVKLSRMEEPRPSVEINVVAVLRRWRAERHCQIFLWWFWRAAFKLLWCLFQCEVLMI